MNPPRPVPPADGARHLRVLGVAVGALAVILALTGYLALRATHHTGSSTKQADVPASWHRPSVTTAGLADRSGVRITRVDVTGGGGLIDLRYQVLDPDRAAALHDTATPPALVDETSGLVVHQLFMDHAHSGPYKQGVTYYYLFNDPGNWVHRGSRVTVLLGNAQVEHITVK
ncbi:hypothetical protein M6D93_02140 [Jatrophihabitans telluris]|uniref:Uncharacterized protein n=1 Tax=Jatrophihabitans telluris TaxID=2038343 RepID=A0ABY4QZR1_9ACTN|nr:hypothetical protein [Jatrophihabitans telluris]UQX88813.1 hypothetical protein M6D93_02140 [Jatrophihabitans telluris]